MNFGIYKLLEHEANCIRKASESLSDITRDRWLLKAKYYRDMIDLYPWTETTIRKVYG